MRNDEFARAFGDTPDSFELAMRRALLQDRNSAPRRVGGRALLIAALIALLAFSAAFAATRGFGLISMMSERFKTGGEVESMLQTAVPQRGEGLSKFDAAIEQVISDGSKVYFTLRISPKAGSNALIMESEMESFPNSQISLDSPETYREKADREGKRLYHAYLYTAWTGEYRTIDGNHISRQIDGDSLVYASSTDCIPDDDGTLKLSVEVCAYDPETFTGPEDMEKAVITADVQNTSDMKSFRWKNPAKIKDLGIQITDLRVTDTPMSRSVQLSYKLMPGLDEAANARASGIMLDFFDEAGNPIETAEGSSMYKTGDTYHQWSVLPADITGAIRIGGLEWLDDDTTKSVGVVTLNTQDAKIVNTAEQIEKKRAAAKKEAETRAKQEADWQAKVNATPAPRPASLPEVRAAGCEIPLLRNYPTEYSGLIDELESIAAPVNLTVKGKSATLTVDQIVPADEAMLVFYTLKSTKKIPRGGDSSLDPWFSDVEKVPYFTATFDGEIPEVTERYLGSFMTCQQFFLDDYTVTGWTLLDNAFFDAVVPKKAWMTLNAEQFGGGLKLDMQLDRTPASGKLSKMLTTDAMMRFKDYPELGVRIQRTSLSPVISTIWFEEDRIGIMPQDFLIVDDQGRTLTILRRGISLSDATPNRPQKEQKMVQFIGGFDAKSITLVPVYEGASGNGSDDHDFISYIPLDAPMPYTITHPGGLKTIIHQIKLDANGMEIRYHDEQPNGRVDFGLSSTQVADAQDETPNGTTVNPWSSNLERDTGIQVSRIRWTPQKGANIGERVPASKIENLKYLRVGVYDYTTDEANAITIPLD